MEWRKLLHETFRPSDHVNGFEMAQAVTDQGRGPIPNPRGQGIKKSGTRTAGLQKQAAGFDW